MTGKEEPSQQKEKMAPATRTRRRTPSNTAEAPPSPYKASSSFPWASKTTKRGGTETAGKGGEKQNSKTAFVTVGTTRFDALVEAVDSPRFERALLSRGFGRLVVQAGAGGHAPEGLLLGLGAKEKREKKKKKGSSAAAAAVAAAGAAALTLAASKRTTRLAMIGTSAGGLSVEFFDYAPSLKDYFSSADLVVTHAGAGSIFETLSLSGGASSSFSSSASNVGGGAGKEKKESAASSPPPPRPPPIPLIAVPNGALMHNHQAELASELEARGLLFSATPETLSQVLQEADFSRLKGYEVGGVGGVVAAIDALSGRSGANGSGSSKKARKGR